MMLLHVVVVLLGMIVSPALLQNQVPPGVPPPVQVHPEGHGPSGNLAGAHGGGFGAEIHNADHIKEHLKDVVEKPKEEMSEDELEFHYFKLHDYDNNNKLDGTEITKAITHFHADEEGDKEDKEHAQHEAKVFSDSEIINIVDTVLQEDDMNKDGYIEYVEFVTAQRKARSNDGK